MHHIDVGETTQLRARFSVGGVATDPTVTTLTITEPDGTTSSPAPTNDPNATGLFTYNLLAANEGVYNIEWVATGAVDAILTDLVLVGPQLAPGPCEPWVAAERLFDCHSCADIAVNDRDWELAEHVARQASEYLHELSAHRFPGLCTATVRPCRAEYGGQWLTPSTWIPDPSWGSCECGQPTPDRCTCAPPQQISLGRRPVVAILQVLIGGVALDPSAYRLDENRWLVRTDGDAWPTAQNLTAADTETGTWSVTFVHGVEPPELGVSAARDLACELYKACAGGECALPPQTTQLTRQGVSLVLQAPGELQSNPALGLRSVALFLRAYNPKMIQRAGHIASPDRPVRVRRT